MSDKTDATRASDVAFIKALAELLDSNDLTEIQVKREYGENDWLNVRVARGGVMVQARCRWPRRRCWRRRRHRSRPQLPLPRHRPAIRRRHPAP
jgi:hypothetical protein